MTGATNQVRITVYVRAVSHVQRQVWLQVHARAQRQIHEQSEEQIDAAVWARAGRLIVREARKCM